MRKNKLKFINHKNYRILSDLTGYNRVKTLCRSTFDLSKFTVAGTPTITDDGITNGFSNSNYIDIPVFDFTKPFKIKFGFKMSEIEDAVKYCYSFAIDRTNNGRFGIAFNLERNPVRFKSIVSEDGVSWKDITYLTIPVAEVEYYVVQEFTGTEFIGTLYGNGEFLEQNKIEIAQVTNAITVGKIGGRCVSNSAYPFTKSSVDLKQFSIEIDGVEVFSGNKTGIDTIKSDDYTIVGTPAITNDGIASDFSGSNYLGITNDITFGSNNWSIIAKINTNSSASNNKSIFASYQNRLISVYLNSLNKLSFNIGNGTDFVTGAISGTTSLALNTEYWVKVEFNGSSYSSYISTDGVNYTLEASTTNNITIPNGHYNIGVSRILGDSFKGSIDLNAFKIYVNDNLIYQPCLKIPFIKNKNAVLNGTERFGDIVSFAYRTRIEDLYNQFGKIPYYTIDEINQNYTLPQNVVY